MGKDQGIGWIVLILSVLGIVFYYYLVFMSSWKYLTIQISAFFAVAMMLLIFAWIGYTLATTPPPMPLDDFDSIDRDAVMNAISSDEKLKTN